MSRKERARGKERERKRRGGKENGTKGRERGKGGIQCSV